MVFGHWESVVLWSLKQMTVLFCMPNCQSNLYKQVSGWPSFRMNKSYVEKKRAYTREIATRKTQHTTNQISAIFPFDCITSRKLKSAIFDFLVFCKVTFVQPLVTSNRMSWNGCLQRSRRFTTSSKSGKRRIVRDRTVSIVECFVLVFCAVK